ncbi:MAG: (d)CMP kinase [Actinomycetota bacterium]
MIVVAIDGPSGVGKSTAARGLARRLGVPHVDTGALYRTAALAVLRAGVDPADGPASAAVVREAAIGLREGRALLDGEDVEEAIRGPEVTASVSAVAAHPEVRAALLQRQRAGVRERGAVVEGRDAGTVVVPDAHLKVWLTAAPAERARRRAGQLGLTAPGVAERLTAELTARDEADAAQMGRAREAVVVATDDLAAEEVLDRLEAMARSALAASRDDEEASR